MSLHALESGIDAPWINVASGKFEKKNKHNPLTCATYVVKLKSFKKAVIRL